MKLTTFILIIALTQVSAKTFSQITLREKNTQFVEVLKQIENQSGFVFLYDYKELGNVKVSVNVKNVSVENALDRCLNNLPFTYKVVGNTRTITIKPKEKSLLDNLISRFMAIDVKGRVVDENREALPGASVMVKESGRIVKTNENGDFYLRNVEEKSALLISYVGYKAKTVIAVKDLGTIILEMEEGKLKEVTVNTGLFLRKAESFTGSAATFTGLELKNVGNINILQSLAILDPSFRITDNLQFGSDPNKLPEVTLRGATSIPDLNATYQNAPNLPLFILDGFETTVQKVYDLNMNMVASVTLLKDASAKAIYGSKAGNGVVVIETLRPSAGKMRVSYTGSLDVTAPDLSSYHMTNAAQKIQAEVLADKYVSLYPEGQFLLTEQYAANLKKVLGGVDTYWLAKPLQNGIGQKHNIYIDGGAEVMRYAAGVNYNKLTGVMIGSDRTNISGIVNLLYRKNNLSFSNNLTIDQNKAVNSPYGSFGSFTKMNPYWLPYDNNGKLVPNFPVLGAAVVNPLYDATLNTKDNASYTNITENFYGEWQAVKNLRVTARVGISSQNNSLEYFIPATHSSYLNVSPADPEYLNRGRFTIGNGRRNSVGSDAGIAYSFIINKHQVFSNFLYSIQQTSNSNNGMTMVGYPNDKLDDISFGKQYLAGSKATGSESTSRNMGITGAVNYSYDNRYLADLSLRKSASSQFGANKRWGDFWSVGLGWNVHRERFMKSLTFIDLLKLRGSVGSTGTQNFSSYQSLTTYSYISDQIYSGELGLKLLALSNPNLKWQQTFDKNIGLDGSLFKRINFRIDYYQSDTKDLLSDQTVVPSTGFDNYKENVGETRNQGLQVNLSTRVYNNPESKTYVSIFANVAHNVNKIRKVSNALGKLNDAQDQIINGTLSVRASSKPVTRFAEGQSLSAIWAVPSLGIDPSNGKEIFVKKDGSRTYIWSAADQVVVGDVLAKYNGTFGANMQHKGFTFNFAFGYRLGGQMYNQALVDKVENADINYNVDVRLFEGRWKTPGQESFFKDIKDLTVTKPSSRFVQNHSELIFSSINFGYDFSKHKFVKALNISSLRATINANDLARIGSVRTERGLDYPFARTTSLSLQANF